MVRGSGSVEAADVEPADDALRDQALDDLDALIDAVADARKDLRSYQSVLEKNHRHLAVGGRASDMAVRFDVRAVRTSLTDRLNLLERARNASRRSLWRLQASEGRTIAEIARIWGLSRQLISRALRS
ncbi:MAG: hypothetical protein QOG50_2854 [Actinomycetota bacterium]|nr:hypothetical protein [Actinomycetota bacterium]